MRRDWYIIISLLLYIGGSRGDMIETYTILKGKYDIAATPYLQPCKQKVTREHGLKLAKSYSRLNVRNNFFSLRITNLWNRLTEHIVTAPSLIAFENRLDKHWQNIFFNSIFKPKNKYMKPEGVIIV